jgi:hypothetical protein
VAGWPHVDERLPWGGNDVVRTFDVVDSEVRA